MKYCALPLAVLVFLLVANTCYAHKVNVFAYVDGEAIQIEGSFSKSQKVMHGRLAMRDSENGDLVHEGTTDRQGRYSFRPSAAFLATGHGLDILLQAGEGHQDTWQVLPAELQGLVARAPNTQPPLPQPPDTQELLSPPVTKEAQAPVGSATVAPGTKDAELEAMIHRVLEAKLAPIKETLGQVLAAQHNTDPELKDIIGGLGWIMGLVGLAAYWRYRRQQ